MTRPRTILKALRDAALVVIALLLLATSAAADPPGRVGRLADFAGEVWYFDAEQGEWAQAVRNRPLTTGDRLATRGSGRAEVEVGSTMLRLDGDSELDLVQLDDERIRAQLDRGSVALRVRSPEVVDEVEVITAVGRFMPTRVGHYRIDHRESASLASAWSGELRFEARDSTLTIGAAQRAQFWQEAPQGATHYTWSTLEDDGFSRWALSQDYDQTAAVPRNVSPEMTGADDLERNGRWDEHPEYGSVWIPTYVAPGWAPYRYGRWAWVRPWGWTWVDDARWGFAPFHYGRWVSWRGHWCWAPGRYVARPVYAPALVGWIGGPHVSVGISVGTQPYFGWVPLGPREVWYPHYRASPIYIRNVNMTHANVSGRESLPRAPAEPVMYTNRGVPGGVTVVPANVLRERRPVSPALSLVDPNVARQVINERGHREAPPPPAMRVAVPSPSAVPAVPAQPQSREGDTRRTIPRIPREPVMRAGVPPPAVVAPTQPAGVAPTQPALQQPPAVMAPRPPAVAVPSQPLRPPAVAVPSQPGLQRGLPRGGDHQADDTPRRRGGGEVAPPRAMPPAPAVAVPPQVPAPAPRVAAPQPRIAPPAPAPEPAPAVRGGSREGGQDGGRERGGRDPSPPVRRGYQQAM